ncbi:hypothetical protein N1851_020036 [Merluccius polli]|uniref:Uncharacterized protein n=1 Tax=Merluccius polli TaxID=89951 RepID=A0AA47ML05_MERPO|nr:hypothetical protein N1851_020036 [Merluccius polli]
MLVQEPGWEFGRDTGVSTPTLAMSATGSLVTTGSQDLGFNVSSERRCSRQDGVPVSIPGHWGSNRGQRDQHPQLALQHRCQHQLVSHPEMDQTSPCLASKETSSVRQGYIKKNAAPVPGPERPSPDPTSSVEMVSSDSEPEPEPTTYKKPKIYAFR